MKIIKYNNYSDIDIEFENGYVSKNNTYQNFKKGQVRNYLIEYVFGVACLGQGKYISEKNDIVTPEYEFLISAYHSQKNYVRYLKHGMIFLQQDPVIMTSHNLKVLEQY